MTGKKTIYDVLSSVIARAAADPQFREALERDPASALADVIPPPRLPLRSRMDFCELSESVARRSLTDKRFKAALKENPAGAIAVLLDLNDEVRGVRFVIHENSLGEVHLVLPLDPRSLSAQSRASALLFEQVRGIESIELRKEATNG